MTYWSQLQYVQIFAHASIPRPQRMHGFRSLTSDLLCNQHTVAPDDQSLGCESEGTGRDITRNDRALRFRKAIERAAARVVGQPDRAAGDHAVDAGGELRLAPAEEAQAEETAQKAAGGGLGGGLRSLTRP